MIQKDTQAPNFTLKDSSGIEHRLSDYLGSWILLYFYPMDDTPGCTKEACMLRDSHETYTKSNIIVLGVSKDSSESHSAFITKYNLPFTLLTDPDKKVIRLYEADSLLMTKRVSYLIDPNGIIKKVYEKVDPETHATEVLSDLEKLNQK